MKFTTKTLECPEKINFYMPTEAPRAKKKKKATQQVSNYQLNWSVVIISF